MARPFSRPQYRSSRVGESSKNALTASGYRIQGERDADAMRRLQLPWQRRSFVYYDTVPEIKYAAQFYAKALALLRLYVGKIQEDGKIEPDETFKPAVEELERLKDPGGTGRENLLTSYGRLRFLTGECYLFVTKDPETDQEQWEMLSMDEIRPDGKSFVRYRAPSLMPETFIEPADDDYDPIDDDHCVVYRLFQRHPRFSEIADSTMQGVLDVCEELVLLTQSVRARTRSRLAGSGILLINGRYIPLPSSPAPGDDPNADPFLDDLVEAMTAPIVNEGTASAVVPHVVRVDVDRQENLDNVMKHIQIVDPMQLYPETGLRYELIKRLAIGLDMPPEILLGLEQANHWTAWQIDEQTWTSHLQPVANALINDLTTAWFQPSLRAAGVSDWQKYVVQYDATAVINHPDRSKDAKDLYDVGELSGDALRTANGFSDEDAPSEEERWRFLGTKIRDASLAIYGIPSLRTGGIEPAAGEVETGQGTTDAPPGSAPAVAKAPPEPLNTAIADAFGIRILGASEVALWRTRELAGSRIRNYARRDDEAFKSLDGVSSMKVGPAIADRVQTLNLPPVTELVKGGADLLEETLRVWGVSETHAKPLGSRLEQFAALTLFDERPTLPDSYKNFVFALVHSGNGNGANGNGSG